MRAECAKVLETLGRTQAALTEYKRALKDSPDLPSAALGIARTTTIPAEAETFYRLAARSLPARAEAEKILAGPSRSKATWPAQSLTWNARSL